jgi:hypothetical protein
MRRPREDFGFCGTKKYRVSNKYTALTYIVLKINIYSKLNIQSGSK